MIWLLPDTESDKQLIINKLRYFSNKFVTKNQFKTYSLLDRMTKVMNTPEIASKNFKIA